MSATIVDEASPAMTPDAVAAKMFVVGASSGPESMQSPRPAEGGQTAGVTANEKAPAKTAADVLGSVAGTGLVATASRVKASGSETAPAAPRTLDNLAKVATDSVENTGSEDAKTKRWNPALAAMLALSDSAGISSHVVINKTKPWVLGKQANTLRTFFSSHELFDIKAKNGIQKDALLGFKQDKTMPFHQMAVICLLTGKNPNRGYFDTLYHLWRSVVKHCIAMCDNEEHVVKDILDHIVQKQAQRTYEHYAMFVNASKDAGMCDRKLECVKLWISKLKEDAETYHEIYRYQEHIKSLQEVIYNYTSTDSVNAREADDTGGSWSK